MTKLAAIALASSLTLVAGCTPLIRLLHHTPRIRPCKSTIPPSTSLTEDFVRRLRIHVEGDGVSEGFEVIAQHRRGRLTLVGLTRFGAKAFTIVQAGDEIQIVSFMKAIEAVPPVNILADLHAWPLHGPATVPTSTHEIVVGADGRSAVLVNRPCGYRTTIYDVTDDGSS